MDILPRDNKETKNKATHSGRFPLAVLVTLAWRNLWRNYRRTLIMLAAITVGVWAMIFMTAMMRGLVDEMVRSSTSQLLGHVQIHQRDYRQDPNIVNSMPAPSGPLLQALGQAPVLAWTSRVRVPAIITSERESTGLTLVGIDPAAERQMSFIPDSITQGRYLESLDDRGVILGARMAEKLETGLGKRIVLMSQDPDNNIVDRGFRIVGVFRTDPSLIEEQYVFTGRQTAQQFLRMGERVSEIEALGSDYRNSSELVEPLQQVSTKDQEVLAWTELDAYLGFTLPLMDGFVLIWIVVVFTALSFGLVNTLAMAVFERVREIGLMMALGVRPSSMLAQVLLESFMLLVLGLAAGNLLAWQSIVPLEQGIDISIVGDGLEFAGMSSVLYPSLLAKDMWAATLVVIVLGLLASLLPAWRAARYHPVQALAKT